MKKVVQVSSHASQRLKEARDILSGRLSVQDTGRFHEGLLSLAESGSMRSPHHEIVKELCRAYSVGGNLRMESYFTGGILPELLNELVAFFRERFSLNWVKPRNIAIGLGVSQLFDAVCSISLNPGDIVVSAAPYYHAFADYPKKWGASFEYIQTSAEAGFKLTGAELDQWIRSNPDQATKVKLLLVVNPSIIGAIYSREEARELIDAARRNNLLIFSDEIYRESVLNHGQVCSFASIEGAQDIVITAHSGSKTRAIADLRIGWIAASEEIVNGVVEYCENSFIYISTLIQQAALMALRIPSSYIETDNRESALRVEQILKWAERLNKSVRSEVVTIPVVPSAGHGILLCFNKMKKLFIKDFGVINSSLDLTAYFMRSLDGEPGVVVGPGHSLGLDDLSVRICFSEIGGVNIHKHQDEAVCFQNGRDALSQALNRIAKCVKAALIVEAIYNFSANVQDTFQATP